MSLQDRIESLKAKHAALESAIAAENRRPYPNEPQIAVLKRQKLAIKDELAKLGPALTH
ncbi:MAG: YdcH family protein [Magnetospirillum sp.]|nr:YdcH family protein [Magnetospirillum sp.]